MLASLASLIALQQLDTAADAARKRLAELPAAEQAIEARLAEANAAVETIKAGIAENTLARRALEKDVAAVDGRLSRFDDHKAAVKTNQEYTALLHEISTAKSDKNALEERILVIMEAADGLSTELRAAEATRTLVSSEGEKIRAGLAGERRAAEAEVARLSAERADAAKGVGAPLLAKYDQLLRQRRGLAVAALAGETCTACHVRLRPHVAQLVRRNSEIVQCESCQRILFVAPAAAAETPAP